MLSPALFCLYTDGLSKGFKESKTGCMAGEHHINHLLYPDDLIIMPPCSAGLQQLLRVCSSNGVQYDIKFNPKKSVAMIVKIKEDKRQKLPVFLLAGKVLNVADKVKH